MAKLQGSVIALRSGIEKPNQCYHWLLITDTLPEILVGKSMEVGQLN